MFEVIYYSLTGNTKKVAEAIATELDVAAENVKTKDKLAEDSFVFLGAGLYGPLRGWGLKRFIDRNSFHGRKVALFGTSGEGKGKEVGALEEAVAAKGAEVAGSFFCRGKFLFFINREHPTSNDLGNARRFAREVAKD
ncbi:MAG: flavodoxin family protein [Planctomycetota bacterium]